MKLDFKLDLKVSKLHQKQNKKFILDWLTDIEPIFCF